MRRAASAVCLGRRTTSDFLAASSPASQAPRPGNGVHHRGSAEASPHTRPVSRLSDASRGVGMPTKTCTDCDKPAKARGLCLTHYQRLRRTGKTSAPPVSLDLVNATVRLPALLLAVVDTLAARRGMTRGEWLRETISLRAIE